MRIEDVRAVLRPRTGWQAVDLGCLLWQRQLRGILVVWFAAAVPIAAAVLFACQGPTVFAFVLFWWLFPLASRGVLFLLSRSLFGEELKGLERVKAATGFGFRGVLRALLIERFAPTRTFSAPIALLEGLKGKARRQRQRVLDRSQGSIVSVALLSLVFVFVVAFGILGVAKFLTSGPDPTGMAVGLAPMLLNLSPLALFAVFFLAVSVMEPLHVAIGFSIYLDGRSHVEGWDVELSLRALGKRLEAQAEKQNARQFVGLPSFGGFLALALWSGFQAGPVNFEPAAPETLPQATIERVLSGTEFHEVETNWRFKLRRERSKTAFEGPSGNSGPGAFWSVVSRLLLLGVYAVLGVGLFFLIRLIYTAVVKWNERDRVPVAEKTKGWSIVEEALRGGTDALPSDVPNAARALFAKGRQAEALGLIYRACLLELLESHDVTIRPSDTESTCLRRVTRRLQGPVSDSFAIVTLAWQRAAYAELRLDVSELERSLVGLNLLTAPAALTEVPA